MPSNIFRMFSPESSKEDRVKKRKAQLRKAQLTYKERKERYNKNLEDRVAEARANEADLYQQIQSLQNTVHLLSKFIQDSGLQVPDDMYTPVDSSQLSEPSPASVWTPQQDSQLSSQFAGDTPDSSNQFQSSLQEASRKAEATYNLSIPLRLGDLDPLAVGMEFVLTFESPCIPHLYPIQDKAHEPNGHTLTVTGQLAPAYPKSALESHTAHETFCRDVPAQSLHNLLNLSSELCPETEITPIQAWHQIRSQPSFGGLEAQNLWALAQRLRDAATCHGFGAVVTQDFFHKTMFETLLIGQAF
ncbi:hypothetical protein F4808DRAFT_463840 [Astrocystis sublimbata]|nr:hypothetical protein F4808DRAFT_463840 [Astrocystis sublimbata]